MLAQSFKTAADLDLTEPQRQALIKTLALFETEKVLHVPEGYAADPFPSFAGQFNMNQWSAKNGCGTVACIGGTAEMVGGVSFNDRCNVQLEFLFYPKGIGVWRAITVAQAATALRSYLTTGEAHWPEAMRQ